jgi:hypothetical protein
VRLLRKSIIHVESEEVPLEQIDYVENQEIPDAERVRYQITYERYERVARLLFLHLKEVEDSGSPGNTPDELIDWYIAETRDDAEQLDEDVNVRIEKCKRIIQRLIHHDRDLIQDGDTGLISISANYPDQDNDF